MGNTPFVANSFFGKSQLEIDYKCISSCYVVLLCYEAQNFSCMQNHSLLLLLKVSFGTDHLFTVSYIKFRLCTMPASQPSSFQTLTVLTYLFADEPSFLP